MENGPEKVRFFEENNMLKRNKHGAGAKFRGFPFFRKKSENGGEKGAQKSSKTLQNRSRSGPGSIVTGPAGDFEKCMFFELKKTEKVRPKILKKNPCSAKSRKSNIGYSARLAGRAPGGPYK